MCIQEWYTERESEISDHYCVTEGEVEEKLCNILELLVKQHSEV